MGFGIYSSIAGANAREIELEVLSNNMANLQTTGFKEIDVSFTSEVDKNLNLDDKHKSESLVREGASHVNFTQGAVFDTGNPLDMAIQGDGFFEVQTPDGPRYTRNGSFSLTKEGTLVTSHGDPVMGDQGPIRFPTTANISVGAAGDILVNNELISHIKITDFSDKRALKAEGNTYYSAAEASPTTPERYQIAQNHLEGSNVDMIRNLTRMVEVSRAYESHQKTLTKQIEASQQLNQVAKIG